MQQDTNFDNSTPLFIPFSTKVRHRNARRCQQNSVQPIATRDAIFFFNLPPSQHATELTKFGSTHRNTRCHLFFQFTAIATRDDANKIRFTPSQHAMPSFFSIYRHRNTRRCQLSSVQPIATRDAIFNGPPLNVAGGGFEQRASVLNAECPLNVQSPLLAKAFR